MKNRKLLDDLEMGDRVDIEVEGFGGLAEKVSGRFNGFRRSKSGSWFVMLTKSRFTQLRTRDINKIRRV